MQPDSASPAPAEASARPKVLRRPAHFSQKTSLTLPPVEDAPKRAAAPVSRLPVPISPTNLPWQEDGRFGGWMLGIVALANLGLALLLQQVTQATPLAPEPSLTLRSRATMPTATASNGSAPVNIYTDHSEFEAE